MKLATCTVSYEGFGTIKGTEKRLEIFLKVLEQLKTHDIQLVCFPGGYLFAKSRGNLDNLANAIFDYSTEHGISVAVGIDQFEKNPDDNWDEAIRNEGLPFFAVCSEPTFVKPRIWNQRSITSRNQNIASDIVCSKPRTLISEGKKIEILICGEIFNQRIRKSIVNRSVDAVVDLGHRSEGFRVHAAMKVLAKRGISTFCSVHTQRQSGQKFCYVPCNNNWLCESSRDYDLLIGEGPRLEIKFWDIN